MPVTNIRILHSNLKNLNFKKLLKAESRKLKVQINGKTKKCSWSP